MPLVASVLYFYCELTDSLLLLEVSTASVKTRATACRTPAKLLASEKYILVGPKRMGFVTVYLDYYEYVVPICDWRNRGLVI